ncbi:MAG: hypothetical protein II119_02190 [Bacilli bacterium]|nr:hypothetical protein [Bacilli bacterium]
MGKEEKLELIKQLYNNIGIKDYELESFRDEEIKADCFFVSNMRGPGGFIVDDNGEYLFCQSAHGFEYWKEEFKKGNRS